MEDMSIHIQEAQQAKIKRNSKRPPGTSYNPTSERQRQKANLENSKREAVTPGRRLQPLLLCVRDVLGQLLASLWPLWCHQACDRVSFILHVPTGWESAGKQPSVAGAVPWGSSPSHPQGLPGRSRLREVPTYLPAHLLPKPVCCLAIGVWPCLTPAIVQVRDHVASKAKLNRLITQRERLLQACSLPRAISGLAGMLGGVGWGEGRAGSAEVRTRAWTLQGKLLRPTGRGRACCG